MGGGSYKIARIFTNIRTYVRTYFFHTTSSYFLFGINIALSLSLCVFIFIAVPREIHLPHPVIVHSPVGYFLIIKVLLVHVIIREGYNSAKTIFHTRYSQETQSASHIEDRLFSLITPLFHIRKVLFSLIHIRGLHIHPQIQL